MSADGSSSPPFYNDYSPDASSDDINNLHYAFNTKIMIAALVMLAIVVFFILMLHFYANVFWFRSSRSIVISRHGGSGAAVRFGHVQPSINTGLDAALIAELPTFTYKAKHSADEESQGEKQEAMEAPLLECAVCLSEFQEDEKGRMLPSCKHTFHTECIDMWFFSHSTCPLCRTVVSASTLKDERQHQGEGQTEAMEASHIPESSNAPPSTATQFPSNVLFWGNEEQIASTQQPSTSSNSKPSPASRRSRALPQISIDIPPIEGGIVVTISTPGRRSSRSTGSVSIDQAAYSSNALKSPPGLRASVKRMLSRQSSRRTAAEGTNEASPKL